MPDVSAKPVIFISYSHKDEPDHPREGEIQWLSFVRSYLQPAVKDGIFDLWVDLHLTGGADLDPEIKRKLQACDIFILLVSASSMASNYIVDTEIATIRDRQARDEDVHFYPLLLTPTPDAGLNKVKDKNLRPRDARPFSGFSYHDRLQHMTEAANEIGKIAQQIIERKAANRPSPPVISPGYVHLSSLPETAYETLRGRDGQLSVLNEAWSNRNINILSLIAEGGAGKSALVNEWLKRMRADSYRSAEAVLGWSFYSQGTKERATSAEQFLNWAIEKLGIRIEIASATAKGEAIAEALSSRRVLLVLDGCEPLQHGLDKQQGELKDRGLRALLRRFAAAPPNRTHGLVVLTSRLAIKDVARWEDGSAPVERVDELSDEAGSALLRDNGVWGTDRQLRAAVHDFGGHPLALGLLASYLKEKHFGDVRQRDRIRGLLHDEENPRHDHARRVMESYEKEWLTAEPVEHAIMFMVGLFDRPASDDCLQALREKPVIKGITDTINFDDGEWERAIARLREARLLAPRNPSTLNALDAHPLVREWFGSQLKKANEPAWKEAHGRLYEHLRDITEEGEMPTLESLAPLYQAISHGCCAMRHQEAIHEVYMDRICRRQKGSLEFYATRMLGAFGSDLAAIASFFRKPFAKPVNTLSKTDRSWVLSLAAFRLKALGRYGEALQATSASLRMDEKARDWSGAAVNATNLCETELIVGNILAATEGAKRAVAFADRSNDKTKKALLRAMYAVPFYMAGRKEDAERLLIEAEVMCAELIPEGMPLHARAGYHYCTFLLDNGSYQAAVDRAIQTIEIARRNHWLIDTALDALSLGRGYFGLALAEIETPNGPGVRSNVSMAKSWLDEAVDGLRSAARLDDIPRGLLARAAFRRSVGDWDGGSQDLDEVEEIAEPGPMKLFLCDMALERARLLFAKMEAFAPLRGLIDGSLPKPVTPDPTDATRLKEGAAEQLTLADDYINTCGYHRRDEELAELQAVLCGARKFADLPPRV